MTSYPGAVRRRCALYVVIVWAKRSLSERTDDFSVQEYLLGTHLRKASHVVALRFSCVCIDLTIGNTYYVLVCFLDVVHEIRCWAKCIIVYLDAVRLRCLLCSVFWTSARCLQTWVHMEVECCEMNGRRTRGCEKSWKLRVEQILSALGAMESFVIRLRQSVLNPVCLSCERTNKIIRECVAVRAVEFVKIQLKYCYALDRIFIVVPYVYLYDCKG